ncbi:MAG: 6-phosphogluconolactonase [Candidatus Eremiobacteraeota bacterium]|nr:6-phosphogluconolactonase [Candidatus Eremiobacteraeota bacterium]
MTLEVRASLAELAVAAASDFVSRARATHERAERFSVALSGGKTPRAMFAVLARPPFKDAVDWRRVHVFWSDERCVDPASDLSNYAAAHKDLLAHVPLPAPNVHRMRGELEPAAGAAAYCVELQSFFGNQQLRLDLVHLGLGPDGHTASLFPGSPALSVSDVACVANYVGETVPSPWRLTLTYPAINAAAAVVFLVAGFDKANALAAVLKEPCAGAELPAARVSPLGRRPIWFVDAAAASKLQGRADQSSAR